jgi:hypothetical protein
MKKILVIILGLTIGLTVISCTDTIENEAVVQSDEQVIALEAISSSMLLSYDQTSVGEMKNPIDNTSLSEEEINDLDYYVEMVEAFLGNDNLEVVSQESDNEDYEMMIVYTTFNLNDDEMVYTLYYNVYDLDEETTTEETTTEEATTEEATTEEATTEETTTEEATTEEPTTEEATTEEATTEEATTEEATTLAFGSQNQTSEEPFRFIDEDDEYATEGIKGILVYGDVTYELEGKILNIEGKEIVRVRSYIDEDNYVIVNYQKDVTEVDKEKFFFQMVEDGQVITRSKVMIFESDNMQHVQIEFIDGDNYERYQFHMREKDGVTYIHINYNIDTEEETSKGNIQLTKTIDPETEEVIYSYKITPNNGQGSEYNKTHKGRPDNAGRSNQDSSRTQA